MQFRTHVAARAAALLAAPALLAGLTSAQTAQTFPLQPAPGAELKLGEAVLTTDLSAIATLTTLDEVVLTGVPLPSGETVSLDLERIDVERRQFGVHVDGVLIPGITDGLGLSVWKGQIAGDEHSDVMLGFSSTGSRGWIRSRHELVHLLAMPHEGGSWRAAPGLLVTEESLNAQGHVHEGNCETRPRPPRRSRARSSPARSRPRW